MELFGATARGLRPGEGEERAARARATRTRATARKSRVDDVLDRADRVRPARPARHLRDERRRRRARRLRASTTRAARGVDRSGAHRRDLDGHARVPADDDRAAELRDRLARPAPARRPAHGFKESIAARAYEEAGHRPRRPRLRRGLRPLDRDGARLVRADRAVRAGRGREAACATARRRSAAASR